MEICNRPDKTNFRSDGDMSRPSKNIFQIFWRYVIDLAKKLDLMGYVPDLTKTYLRSDGVCHRSDKTYLRSDGMVHRPDKTYFRSDGDMSQI